MGNRILEIVVYLMDRLHDGRGNLSDIEVLSSDLRGMGYSENEIATAYSWVVDRFEQTHETYFTQFPSVHSSNRVLTQYERLQLDPDAYGYLVKLVHLNVIDDEQFESILERAATFGSSQVTIEHVKLAASEVLFREFGEPGNYPVADIRIDPTLSIN